MGSGGEEASSESVLSDSSFDERGPGRRFVYFLYLYLYFVHRLLVLYIFVQL